jgi:hypothetical protein
MDPPVLYDNVFLENSALYGANTATEGASLVLGDSEGSLLRVMSSVDYHITSYTDDFSLLVSLQDYYGNKVTKGTSLLRVSLVDEFTSCASDAYLSGSTYENIVEGVANFSNFQIHCSPYGVVGIKAEYVDTATTVESVTFTAKFRGCWIGEKYENGECIECPNGYYSLVENATDCLPCPDNAKECYGKTIVVEEGYWRISSLDDNIMTCPLISSSCKQGDYSGQDSCNAGYEGPLCGVCSANYYLDSFTHSCKSCSDSSITVVGAVLIALAGVAVIILFFTLAWPYIVSKISKFTGIGMMWSDTVTETFKKKWIENTRKSKLVQNKFKLITSLYQILSTLPTVLSLVFPSSYYKLLNTFTIINLTFINDLGLHCFVSKFDYVDFLQFTTVFPMLVAALIFIMYCVHRKSVEVSSALPIKYNAMAVSELNKKLVIVRSTYMFVFIVFTYLTLPGISISIFQMLNPCTDVDPNNVEPGYDKYLTVDLTISCDSHRYRNGVVWAYLMIIVYPVGLPLFYFYLLHSFKDVIYNRRNYSADNQNVSKIIRQVGADVFHTKRRNLASLNFLYSSYKPKYWYFEVVDTYRRIFFTGGLTLLAPLGSQVQLMIGILLASATIFVYQTINPYESKELGYSAVICLWQVVIVLSIAILIQLEANISRAAITAVLLFSILSILVYEIGTSLYKLKKKQDKKRLNIRVKGANQRPARDTLTMRAKALQLQKNKKGNILIENDDEEDASSSDDEPAFPSTVTNVSLSNSIKKVDSTIQKDSTMRKVTLGDKKSDAKNQHNTANVASTTLKHRKKQDHVESHSEDSEIITNFSSENDDFDDYSISDSECSDMADDDDFPSALEINNVSKMSYFESQNEQLATLSRWSRDQIHLQFDSPDQQC